MGWGRDSLDDQKKPHTYTLDREFFLSENGGCRVVSVADREKWQVERRLKACGALGPKDKISGAMEAVLFNDTLRDIEKVTSGDLNEDCTIPVNSVETYEVIAEFGQMIGRIEPLM